MPIGGDSQSFLWWPQEKGPAKINNVQNNGRSSSYLVWRVTFKKVTTKTSPSEFQLSLYWWWWDFQLHRCSFLQPSLLPQTSTRRSLSPISASPNYFLTQPSTWNHELWFHSSTGPARYWCVSSSLISSCSSSSLWTQRVYQTDYSGWYFHTSSLHNTCIFIDWPNIVVS